MPTASNSSSRSISQSCCVFLYNIGRANCRQRRRLSLALSLGVPLSPSFFTLCCCCCCCCTSMMMISVCTAQLTALRNMPLGDCRLIIMLSVFMLVDGCMGDFFQVLLLGDNFMSCATICLRYQVKTYEIFGLMLRL